MAVYGRKWPSVANTKPSRSYELAVSPRIRRTSSSPHPLTAVFRLQVGASLVGARHGPYPDTGALPCPASVTIVGA